MNRAKFIEFLNYPEKLDEKSLQDFFDLVEEFPYCHSAHFLLLKNLKNLDSIKFGKQLKASSVMIADRAELKFFIEEKPGRQIKNYSFENEEIKKTELKHRKEIKAEVKSKEEDLISIKDSKKITVKEAIERQKKITETLNKEYLDSFHSSKTDENKSTGNETSDKEESNKSLEINSSPGEILSSIRTSYKSTSPKPTKKKGIENNNQKRVLFPPPFTSEKYQSILKSECFEPEKKQETIIENENKQSEKDKIKGKKKDSLIDKFIKNDPKIEVKHSDGKLSKSSDFKIDTDMKDEFFTETLAKIYIEQKHFQRAIKAYEKLILKFPDKSAYFAAQIENLKHIVNKQ